MLFPAVLLLKFPATLSFMSTNPEIFLSNGKLKNTGRKYFDVIVCYKAMPLLNLYLLQLGKSKKKRKLQMAKDTAQQDQKDLAGGDSGMVDIWDDKGDLVIKTKKKPKTSVIPAVEVEPQGCSFNPPSKSHQDALACAVADEMLKIYKNELGPEPIPLIVPGEAVNEDMYSLKWIVGVTWRMKI